MNLKGNSILDNRLAELKLYDPVTHHNNLDSILTLTKVTDSDAPYNS